MKMIKCIHCGQEDPEFDYAHVCMTGPYAIKLPEPEYTPEEDEAWKELESRLNELQNMTKEALQTYFDKLKIPRATREDLETLEREARRPKKKLHPIIPLLEGDQND